MLGCRPGQTGARDPREQEGRLVKAVNAVQDQASSELAGLAYPAGEEREQGGTCREVTVESGRGYWEGLTLSEFGASERSQETQNPLHHHGG